MGCSGSENSPKPRNQTTTPTEKFTIPTAGPESIQSYADQTVVQLKLRAASLANSNAALLQDLLKLDYSDQSISGSEAGKMFNATATESLHIKTKLFESLIRYSDADWFEAEKFDAAKICEKKSMPVIYKEGTQTVFGYVNLNFQDNASCLQGVSLPIQTILKEKDLVKSVLWESSVAFSLQVVGFPRFVPGDFLILCHS